MLDKKIKTRSTGDFHKNNYQIIIIILILIILIYQIIYHPNSLDTRTYNNSP